MRNRENYKELPFDPRLKNQAKGLRKAGILHEALLWNQLKGGKLNELDFDRQKVIGEYIVDFYCAERKVVIEVDGDSHDGKIEYDATRDEFLGIRGLSVIHIPARSVLKSMDEVLEYLRVHPALARVELPE